jgi:hypothetical protein
VMVGEGRRSQNDSNTGTWLLCYERGAFAKVTDLVSGSHLKYFIAH